MEGLKKIADDIFRRFPKEGKVFVTSDGQAFLDEAHAKNHAKNNRTEKELKVETFLREDGAESDMPKEAGKLIAIINATVDVEAVRVILEAENAGGKRKTVLEAAEKRIAELAKPE